jgi:hypothetical protein
MPMETETPAVEMLEHAVYKVKRAKSDVEIQRKNRDSKQRAASKASELEEAAPLERKNAEARYLVLKNRLESVDAETKEIGHAEAADTILSTIKHWRATARNLHHTIKGYVDNLGPAKISASVRTEAEKVQRDSDHVERELAALEADEKKIDNAVKGFLESTPPVRKSGSQEKTGQQGQQKPPVRRGKSEGGSGGTAYDPDNKMDELRRAVSKARQEYAAARAAEELAPAAARRKQAELQVAEKMLQASEEGLTVAEAELSRIQQDYFVTRIVVGKPDAEGWAMGKAYVKNDIPPGYRLSWKAGNADIKPMNPQGTGVRINVGMLPIGTTMARATIEEIPKDVVAAGEDVVAAEEDVVVIGEDVVVIGEDVVVIEEDVVVIEEDVAAPEVPDDSATEQGAAAPET